MRIGELMRQEALTADLAETLCQAATRMRYADISAPPVVEGGPLSWPILMRTQTMSWPPSWSCAFATCRTWRGDEMIGIVWMHDLLLLEALRPSGRPVYMQTHHQ